MAENEGEGIYHETVTLVDRACTGGFEFWFAGRPWVFKPNQLEMHVAEPVAAWLFAHDHTKVYTKDGDYVQRLGVQIPTRALLAADPECGNCDPIEIDTNRDEGWDTGDVDRSRAVLRKVNVPASEFRDRQGSGATPWR